jgi:hypothetical protein
LGEVRIPSGWPLGTILALPLLSGACGSVEQPKWLKNVAAYEVPLPTAADKVRFLDLLRKDAGEEGFHVDAASDEELKTLSEVSPITFNAAVWRGKDDDEPIASAMDAQDHIGRVWLSFSLGQDPARSARFRELVVSDIKGAFPETAQLPIMPNGAIPNPEDLIRTASGYSVNPSAAAKYDESRRK